MKREFLNELGIEAEAVDKIMAENGRDIEGHKARAESAAKERDALRREFDAVKESAARQKAQAEYDSALRARLAGERFSSEYAKDGVFNEMKAKGMAFENGEIIGFEEALSELKSYRADAFAGEEAVRADAPKLVIPPTGEFDSGSFESREDTILKFIKGIGR